MTKKKNGVKWQPSSNENSKRRKQWNQIASGRKKNKALKKMWNQCVSGRGEQIFRISTWGHGIKFKVKTVGWGSCFQGHIFFSSSFDWSRLTFSLFFLMRLTLSTFWHIPCVSLFRTPSKSLGFLNHFSLWTFMEKLTLFWFFFFHLRPFSNI